MKTEIRYYNLPEMPFSQGYAVNQIARDLKSKVTKAGDFILPRYEGCFIYVETTRGQGIHKAQSIWYDHGDGCYCVMFDIGQGWQYTEIAKKEGFIIALPIN